MTELGKRYVTLNPEVKRQLDELVEQADAVVAKQKNDRVAQGIKIFQEAYRKGGEALAQQEIEKFLRAQAKEPEEE